MKITKLPFGKEEVEQKPKTLDENIAEQIMNQNDRLTTLFNILNRLPRNLVEWTIGIASMSSKTKSYVGIDIATTFFSDIFIPGDLVVIKNRDPKIDDIIRICFKNIDNNIYENAFVKVKKVDFKNGTLTVESPITPESRGSVRVNNIIYIVDKVIPFGTEEWNRTVKALKITYDLDDIQLWLKQSIEYIEKASTFYNKDTNLKKLNERVKLVKKQ